MRAKPPDRPGHGRPAVSNTLLLLALATENAELRAQLAEVQDQCVELAVDAGEPHAEVEALRRELTQIRAERVASPGKRIEMSKSL